MSATPGARDADDPVTPGAEGGWESERRATDSPWFFFTLVTVTGCAGAAGAGAALGVWYLVWGAVGWAAVMAGLLWLVLRVRRRTAAAAGVAPAAVPVLNRLIRAGRVPADNRVREVLAGVARQQLQNRTWMRRLYPLLGVVYAVNSVLRWIDGDAGSALLWLMVTAFMAVGVVGMHRAWREAERVLAGLDAGPRPGPRTGG